MSELGAYDPDQLQLPSGSFIRGAFVPGDGHEYDVIRPSDGRVARRERGASSALVDRAVTEAARAFQKSGWAESEPRFRGHVLRRWADLVDENAEELARLESVVSSRIVSEARVRDVRMTSEVIRYYGELVDKMEGRVLASPSDVWSFLLREPYGVVAGISPWNVPLLLATVKLAPALAAGNAIVLKPSEMTPYSVLRLAQLGHDAGLPTGQIAILPGLGSETGRSLVSHPLVSYVSFTGSTATGSCVMSDAAMNGSKPVALELGGKSPQLVFADVGDLDDVAKLIASGICRNAGQVCFAGTRLVVEQQIADQLTEKVTKLVAQVRPGPTWDPTTTLAPIISKRQADRIDDILRRSAAQGAEIVAGGDRIETTTGGTFYRPTIVRNAKPENPVIREEVFGPVLAVQPFRDLEEGLALADHPIYGLAGAVHTKDIDKAFRAARSMQAGTVWINHYGPTSDLAAPMGGYKQSGFGKDLGVSGLDKYLKTKNVWMKVHEG
jgi:aldehyde dehydrogenase (NAD+)